MNSARRPVATAMAGAFALLVGSVAASAQTVMRRAGEKRLAGDGARSDAWSAQR